MARILAATGHLPRAVSFAARTDAGVHAQANLVSLRLPHLPGMHSAMMRVCHAWEEDDGLHSLVAGVVSRRLMARAMACGKHYRYLWTPGGGAYRADAWPIVPQLNLAAMQQAAALLVGTHDFSAWRAAGCSANNPVKTLHRVELRAHGQALQLHVHGDSFLRKMVRIIAGTLAEVGCGLRPVSSVAQLLHMAHNGTRDAAGVTAPACGLTLMAVHSHAVWDAQLHQAFPPVEACA